MIPQGAGSGDNVLVMIEIDDGHRRLRRGLARCPRPSRRRRRDIRSSRTSRGSATTASCYVFDLWESPEAFAAFAESRPRAPRGRGWARSTRRFTPVHKVIRGSEGQRLAIVRLLPVPRPGAPALRRACELRGLAGRASPRPPPGSRRRARTGGRARARPRRSCRCRRRSRGTSRPRATRPGRSAAGRRAASASGSRSSPGRSARRSCATRRRSAACPRAAFSAVTRPGAMYGSRSTASESKWYALGILDVDEDRVVLGRPAALRARAVVVGPDDLVEEALAAEDLVEQHLARSAPRGSRGGRRGCRRRASSRRASRRRGSRNAEVVVEAVVVRAPADALGCGSAARRSPCGRRRGRPRPRA